MLLFAEAVHRASENTRGEGTNMRPLFTIHGGEYLVGDYIERTYKNVRVWIPSSDTGIDLLVTDRRNRKAVSLQVKYSKDFLPGQNMKFKQELRACGWWTINRKKLRSSPADYWVFVLPGFASRSSDFVVVPTRELARRLAAVHPGGNTIQSYLWVTNAGRCWETRGLRRDDHLRIAYGRYRNQARDFTAFLNNWAPIARINARARAVHKKP